MADTEPDVAERRSGDRDRTATTSTRPAENALATPARTDMTVAEMREWLRNWVANATGQSPDAIDESAADGRAGPVVARRGGDGQRHRGPHRRHADGDRRVPAPDHRVAGDRDRRGRARSRRRRRRRSTGRATPTRSTTSRSSGLATRFPGDMNTPDEMWQALLEGRDAITDLPEGRWSEFLDEPRIAERVAKARTRGGYLTDIKGFDAEFFALAKMEADNIDPQQRMALELTWEALEHARIPASVLRGQSVGVYVGSSTNDYSFLAVSDPSVAHPYAITGTASSIIANRVSYFYDFRGPSIAIDTACSSSLVAVHQGVQALRAGEADVVARRRRQRADHPARHHRLRRSRRRAGARRPDQVVLAGRRRLRPLRGRRHAGAQARGRRPPRRRRDPRGHRGQRGQPRRPVQRPARAEPRRAGRGAAQGLQGRRHRSAHRRLHRGARHRHHPR